MADMLSSFGLTVPELCATSQLAIRQYIPATGATENPVDLTLNSIELVMPTIEVLEKSDDIDLIVLVSQLASGEILPIDPVRMRAIMDRQAKPVVIWTYTLPSDAGLRAATEGGLFLNLDLRNCVSAIQKLVGFTEHRNPVRDIPAIDSEQHANPHQRVIAEYDTKKILARYGFPQSAEKLAHSAQEAVRFAGDLGFPVALKVQSPDLPHKTEAGGVVLGLKNEQAVAEAYDRILAAVARSAHIPRIDGVLVQRMAPKGHELVVGMVNDATFGPIMMVGLGGISIELFGDVTHRPAPVSATEALEMFGKLKSHKLFSGFRGAKPIDLMPVANLVALISKIALEHCETILDMEFNPVIVHEDGSGVSVVDALITLAEDADATALLMEKP